MLQIHAMEGKNDSKHFNNSTDKHKNEKEKKISMQNNKERK